MAQSGEHRATHQNLSKQAEMTRSIKKQMNSQKLQQKMQSQEFKVQAEQSGKRPNIKERRARKHTSKERMKSLQVNEKSSDSSNDNRPLESSSFGPSGSQKDAEIISEEELLQESTQKKSKDKDEIDPEVEQEAMNMVGKNEDEIRARKITKEKLKVTKVPNLVLGYQDDVKQYFRHYYEYIRFLGTGSFGFVVAGTPKDRDQVFALKVSSKAYIAILEMQALPSLLHSISVLFLNG